ncbi:MAG TPA: hypothetical protein VLI68_05845 [Hanamia sp.]|jgi:hypothetical protein|nr:hypothetical protein [Hanamia sp.]
MKRLIILLTLMTVAVFLMLPEKDRDKIEQEGKKIKKKLKKTHFPKNETASA